VEGATRVATPETLRTMPRRPILPQQCTAACSYIPTPPTAPRLPPRRVSALVAVACSPSRLRRRVNAYGSSPSATPSIYSGVEQGMSNVNVTVTSAAKEQRRASYTTHYMRHVRMAVGAIRLLL